MNAAVVVQAGSLPSPAVPEGTDLLPAIGHIVVLMKENHSFDNYFSILGRGDGFTLDAAGQPTNRSATGTLVQRSSRYLTRPHLPVDHTAQAVCDALTMTVLTSTAHLRRSLTCADFSSRRRIRIYCGRVVGGGASRTIRVLAEAEGGITRR